MGTLSQRANRMAARRSGRGFTLLEVMVAIGVASITVMLATQAATMVIRSNFNREQATDKSMRTRTLLEQMQADVQLAGMGSTGAIGVDPADPTFTQMVLVNSAGGVPSIPAIAGSNSLRPPGPAYGTPVTASDAVQMVVPNPRTTTPTTQRAPAGTATLEFVDSGELAGCPLVYINDHSEPNGVGRTQLAFTTGRTPTTVSIRGSLLFTVNPGSDVSCARISTYWVAQGGVLFRSDAAANGAMLQLLPGPVTVPNPAPVTEAVAATGVMNMQIAYLMSSEAFRTYGRPVPLPDMRTMFANAGSGLEPFAVSNPEIWFEVRGVRFNLLVSNQKAEMGRDTTTLANPGMREDGDPGNQVIARKGEWTTFAESATSLRFFDQATTTGVQAEPY